MTWYYAVGSERKGPVSDMELEELIRAGTINRNTLVWRSGMGEWLALSAARPGTFPEDSSGSDGTRCVECGQVFPPSELITISGSRVCGTCKPLLLQRLSEGAALSGVHGLRWEGNKLVCHSETPFPDWCVKCNEPANGFRLKRVMYWQHPAYYLLLLCNLLIMAIVIMIVRKKAILHVGLCEAHRQQRKNALITAWACLLAGVLCIILSFTFQYPWLALAGLCAIIFSGIWGVLKCRVINASKIDKDEVWLSGVNEHFLNKLQ